MSLSLSGCCGDCPTTPTTPCTCPTCPSQTNCKSSIFLQRPSIKDLLLNSEANITCTLKGLQDPSDANFTWSPDTGNTPVLLSAQEDSCGCYSVSSVLSGCAELWKEGNNFTCTVQHPEIEGSLTDTISKDTGEPTTHTPRRCQLPHYPAHLLPTALD